MNVKEFFENATINELISTSSSNVLNIHTFNNITFSNYCSICNEKTTFKSNISRQDIDNFEISSNKKSTSLPTRPTIKTELFIELSKTMYYLDQDKNRFIDFTFTIKCECQQCQVHNSYFLVNIQSKTYCSDFFNTQSKFYENSLSDFIISKKGVYPLQDLTLNKSVQKFLDRESSGWYYKANKCLNEGLAIGSFAYFRRIIEKELLHIVEFVKKVNPDKSDEVEKLINEYNNGGKKANILYDGIFKYLPASLQSLGDNPIKILYNKTSGGLHEYDEEHCTELSNSINKLLEFVIEKLYEEREQVSIVKNIIKDLK